MTKIQQKIWNNLIDTETYFDTLNYKYEFSLNEFIEWINNFKSKVDADSITLRIEYNEYDGSFDGITIKGTKKISPEEKQKRFDAAYRQHLKFQRENKQRAKEAKARREAEELKIYEKVKKKLNASSNSSAT